MSIFSIIFNIFGSFMFVADLILDLVLVRTYWEKTPCHADSSIQTDMVFNSTNPRNELEVELNYKLYAVICLVISLVPTYIQSLCSFYIFWRMEKANYNPQTYCRNMVRLFFVHVIPVHFMYRSAICIIYSCKFYDYEDPVKKKEYWQRYVAAKQDLVLLKVIDACLECAPQLMLQIYVFRLEQHQNCFDQHAPQLIASFISVQAFQKFKIFLSWFSMTQNFAFYPNDQRLDGNRYRDGIEGTCNFAFVLILNFFWHGFTIGVRVSLFSFLISIHPVFTFSFLAGHILVFFVFIKWLFKTDYIDRTIKPTALQGLFQVIYEFLSAMVLTITWVNLFRRDRPDSVLTHQKRMIMFYVIITLENLILLMIWYAHRTTFPPVTVIIAGQSVLVDYDQIMLWFLPTSYVYGILMMVLYYSYCHPKMLTGS